MNPRHLLARISLLTLLMLLALPAAAQEALPQYQTGITRTIPPVAAPISPINGATLQKSQTLTWSHYGAQTYILKFRIVESGKLFKWKPTGIYLTCGADSCLAGVPVEVLLMAKHGQTVKWRVISVLDDVKSKSANATATIEEGPVAQAISPLQGSSIKYYNLLNYEWVGSFKATNYTFKLYNVSGTLIYSYTGSAYEMCGVDPAYCSYPHHSYLQSLMIPSQVYSWRIEIKTQTEKALKSPRWTFTYAL